MHIHKWTRWKTIKTEIYGGYRDEQERRCIRCNKRQREIL
jgi:hypothetical protein